MREGVEREKRSARVLFECVCVCHGWLLSITRERKKGRAGNGREPARARGLPLISQPQ